MLEKRTPKEVKEVHGKVFEITLALYRVTDFFPQGEVLRKNIREKANEIFGGITEYDHSFVSAEEAASIIAKIGSMKGFLAIARSMRFVNSLNIAVLEREYGNLSDFFIGELEEERGQEIKPIVEPVQISPSHNGPQILGPVDAEILPTWNEFSLSKNHVKGHKESKGHTVEKKRTEILPALIENDSGMGVKNNRTIENNLVPISEILNERQKRIVEHLKDRDQAKISDFYSFFTDISSKTIQRDLQDLVLKNMLKKEGEKRWTVYSLNNAS